MDKKDQKLLTELTLNSRIPVNQLARKIGVSREVATYRLNNLIKDKIILGFYTVINLEALGYSRFTCFFQLKGITSTNEQEFMDFIVNHNFVTYMSSQIGKWNIVFDILARDRKQLEKIIKEITDFIPEYLESYIIIGTGAEQEIFPTKLFGINKEVNYNISSKKIKLDKTDLKILSLISSNSRSEYKEIAKELNLSGNAIKYRIKNLEKKGIILGYTISVDFRKLGFEWYNIQLKLTSNKKESLLKQFFRQKSQVGYYYKYLGHENWDIDIGVIVKNSLELRDFVLELREKFGDILKIYDSYVVVEELKGSIAPKGIFKK